MDLDREAQLTAAADLPASPEWYPLSVAGDCMSFLRLSEADYAAASFLDERLLERHGARGALPVAEVAAAASSLAPRAHYIFHIGHVGSTLISRLIGASAAFFVLREPALLRARTVGCAEPAAQISLPLLLGLLARTWRPDQRCLIKLTSIVNEIAPDILAASEAPRALLVFARPLAYLRGIFGGFNSRLEARALAPSRLKRLALHHPMTQSGGPPRSEGEWHAMSWLAEMTALAALAQTLATQVHWVDFDEFLAAPASGLASMLLALGSPPVPAAIDAVIAGPIMRRYSKAPEYAYDAALRHEVLMGADRDFPSEIRRGMSWLEGAARRDAGVGAILEARG